MDIQKLKAELIEEILDTIHEELSSMNACATEKAKADDTASKAVNEGTEMPVDEKAKLEASEEIKEDGTMEAAAEVKEQTAEEKPAEEKPAEEKKDEEVIRLETLNSSPIPTLNSRRPAWKEMKPDEFIRWIDSGAYKTAELY